MGDKERCKTCKHMIKMTWEYNKAKDSSIACGYILDTGHRRPCSGENCTVYEKAKVKRKPKRFVF